MNDVERFLAHAVQLALAEPRGPVHLDLPADVAGAAAGANDEKAIGRRFGRFGVKAWPRSTSGIGRSYSFGRAPATGGATSSSGYGSNCSALAR